ncbi:Flavobacterial-specific protein antigen [Geofilum rubicundum JCM 15548]|uniref:Flavobacterial-specific protein antigen n=2 Tax=Geofilum TaxID=1236988 RepID=A0A0E9LXW3_9BACT|nr:Flavobacterial-specific protein antigen [Geofilum rubicundum JCM 15548]
MKTMKNLMVTALLTFLVSFGSMAQNNMWVGGTLSISSSENGTDRASTTLMPQFGMHLNSNWSVGGSLGFSSSSTDDGVTETKYNTTSLVPFARYWFSEAGNVRFFGQGELPLRFHAGEVNGNDLDGYNSVGLVARPGLGVSLSERWGLTMLMPPVFSFVNTDGSTNFYFGINDGYNIQDYLLDTSVGIIYKF